MGEIKDFVELYIESSDILEDATDLLATDLQNNIKKEAPYKEGRLKRSIRVDTRIYKNYSLVTGYWDEGVAPHGIFVLAGTRPHAIVSKKGPGSVLSTPFGIFRMIQHPGTKPNDFLGRGLRRTVEAYQ